MASSAVTAPRSLADDRQRIADETRQQPLDAAALEDDGEEPGKAGGRYRCDGVFGGDGTAVIVVLRKRSEMCHFSIVTGYRSRPVDAFTFGG